MRSNNRTKKCGNIGRLYDDMTIPIIDFFFTTSVSDVSIAFVFFTNQLERIAPTYLYDTPHRSLLPFIYITLTDNCSLFCTDVETCIEADEYVSSSVLSGVISTRLLRHISGGRHPERHERSSGSASLRRRQAAAV